MVRPLLATTLYLCAVNADIAAADGSKRQPANPVPRRTKKHGEKIFAAQQVGEWEIGYRVGAALRRAESAERGEAGPGSRERRPRPHVRRAHFRNQPVGPRSEGRRELRWINLAFVNLSGAAEELPAVVRPVGGEVGDEPEGTPEEA